MFLLRSLRPFICPTSETDEKSTIISKITIIFFLKYISGDFFRTCLARTGPMLRKSPVYMSMVAPPAVTTAAHQSLHLSVYSRLNLNSWIFSRVFSFLSMNSAFLQRQRCLSFIDDLFFKLLIKLYDYIL